MSMLNIKIQFLWYGDCLTADVDTNGEQCNVHLIEDENGTVPDVVDWDMIETVQTLAICFWMDEQATFYLSAEIH